MRVRNNICPAGYKLVEYLQSTGTQYIELPFGFERTDKVEFDFSMDSNQTTDKYMISPKIWNNNNNRFAMGVHGGKWTCGFGNVNTGSTYLRPSTNYDTLRHLWIYKDSIFAIPELNISYDGTSSTFGGVTANLKLFYGYNANTKGKIYSYKHWKNNTLTNYLIPTIRKSDNKPGLYDLIQKNFYTNNGTEEFLYGNEIFDSCKFAFPIPAPTPTGHIINLTLSTGQYSSCIYSIYDGNVSTGTLLTTMTGAGKTATVTCSTGQLSIRGSMQPGGISNYGTLSGGVTFTEWSGNTAVYSITGDGSISGFQWGCFVEGTQITLSDYTTKNVEDITYDDELLVWDFYEGKLSAAKPTWIMQEGTATEYKKITLSDGTIMKLVGDGDNCHRLFNIDKQQMLYANECIGNRVYKQDGTIVIVLSCEKVQEEVKYYNLTTEKYLDCFAEGVLTGSRLNNMYHISDMKYDSDVRLITEEEEEERWKVRSSLAQEKTK